MSGLPARPPSLRAASKSRGYALGAAALAAIGLVAFLLFSGGGSTKNGGGQPPPEGLKGDLVLGSRAELGSREVNPAGGTLTLNRPGDPLDGLEVVVPNNSYDTPRTFTVSSRPITGHTYGQNINPISPLISVENGGGYSSELLTVKVPVNLPQGQFAMGFFYDEKTHALEGMPLAAEEPGAVTVVTRHFSDFFITMVAEAAISNAALDSGFRPGVDDWNFVNWGSDPAPGGNCAGQSISSIWYYYERGKKGGTRLYNLYDVNGRDRDIRVNWQNDSRGYRLASAVQGSIEWGLIEQNALEALSSLDPRLTFAAFAYAMQVTQGPQLVGVRSSAGGGHMVVAYRIGGGNIYVADPNKPGQLDRTISYQNGRLGPYDSAQAAGQPGKKYETVFYFAVSAIIDWGAVAQRWSDFDNGAVGDDLFPGYKLEAKQNTGPNLPLVNGFITDDPLLNVALIGSKQGMAFYVYRDGRRLTPVKKANNDVYQLAPGNNHLGIYVVRNALYVDFQWLDVGYNQVTISPNPLVGKAGDDLSISATMTAKVDDGTYEWDFGDNTPRENLTLKAQHVFAKQGEYRVKLTVREAESDRILGVGETVARIGQPPVTPTPARGPTPTPGPQLGFTGGTYQAKGVQITYSVTGASLAPPDDSGILRTHHLGKLTGGTLGVSGTVTLNPSAVPDRSYWQHGAYIVVNLFDGKTMKKTREPTLSTPSELALPPEGGSVAFSLKADFQPGGQPAWFLISVCNFQSECVQVQGVTIGP